MTSTIFEELSEELHQGAVKRAHPFSTCTMGTVGLDRMPRLRTIVIRDVSDELFITFYTDKRSKKVMHINENNRVSLLFYHPKKLLQLKVEGVAIVHSDKMEMKKIWNNFQDPSKKDYTTAKAPGSLLKDPDTLEYLEDGNYFCTVQINPFKIEYLKLTRPNHIRVQYTKIENAWQSEFLVP